MINITFEMLNLSTIFPILILCFGALFLLSVSIFSKEISRSFCVVFATLFLILDFIVLAGLQNNQSGAFGLISLDGISILTQGIIVITAILFLLLMKSGKKFHESSMPEFFVLYLFATAGFQLMSSSSNLILIFIGLEMASLALYTIIAMHNRLRAIEAAVKYFTMGALAAGFFVFSAMIFYMLTGSLDVAQISNQLSSQNNTASMYALFAAMIFMLASLGFKLSLIPFHTWTPDVYEGSSEVLAGYMSIIPKIAAFAVVIRIFVGLKSLDIVFIDSILLAISVITMTFGNLMALVQKDVKRMLAFSSISHAGFALAAIFIGTSFAIKSLFFYWILFLFTNLGAFGMLWIARTKTRKWDERYDHPFSKYAGMINIFPRWAIPMSIFMLALAGLPPFTIFWGKLAVIAAAIDANFVSLAVVMVINSTIAIYYYLKLVVYMLLHKQNNQLLPSVENSSNVINAVIGVCILFTVLSLFFIDFIKTIIESYI